MPSLFLRCGSALLAEEEQRNNLRTATALACISFRVRMLFANHHYLSQKATARALAKDAIKHPSLWEGLVRLPRGRLGGDYFQELEYTL